MGSLPLAAFGRSAGNDTIPVVSPPASVTPGEARNASLGKGAKNLWEMGSLPLAAFGRSAGNDTVAVVSPPASVTPGEARNASRGKGGQEPMEDGFPSPRGLRPLGRE